MGQSQVWGEGAVGTAIGCAVWNVRTVLACDWAGGRLLAFAVETGSFDVWGEGYDHPEGIDVDGDLALVTEQSGTLLLQDLNTPGRAAATVVASGLGAPHQVVRTAPGTALLADFAGGRLLSVDVAGGAVTEVALGLDRPVGVAVDADGTVYVTEQGTGSLTRITADGTRSTVVTGLVSPFFLGWGDEARTALVVTERAPAHRVGVVDLKAAVPTVTRLLGRGVTQPSSTVRVADRLVVAGEQRLLSLDASGGLSPGVRLHAPAAPLWPGSWQDVEIDPGLTGYRRADLSVAVEPAGSLSVSEHPGADLDPDHPTVRLLAGAAVGMADVVARDAVTGAEVGRAAVAVGTDELPGIDGPPTWLDGRNADPRPLRTLELKRGTADDGLLVKRDAGGALLPSWRVAVVLVDTGDAVWPTTVTPTTPAPTVAQARQTWAQTVQGATGIGAFYREMSGNRFGVTLAGGGVQGPVHLGGTWTDWYDQAKDSGQWIAKPAVLDKVVSELVRTGMDLTSVDSVFMVVRSSGGRFVWPRAGAKVRNQRVKAPDGTDRDVLVAPLNMCHDQTTMVGFTDVNVSAHELGHTLGLDDLYMTSGFSDAMKKRDLGGRELMAHEDALPHLSVRHKLLLGFLDPSMVRTVTYGTTVDEPVVLHPANGGLPPAGRFAAVRLEVAPGVSWFFELRQADPARLGDAGEGGTGVVLGYDAWSYQEPPVAADTRRPIILLLDDGDGEGPVLVTGQDYEVLSTDDPGGLSTFRLEVVSMTAGSATVRVIVRPVKQPDPAIRNNPGNGDYRSPDMELRTAISDADPAFLNRPIIGINNRVVAKVTNIGGLPAPGVVVRFKVLPFNTDDPDSQRWQELGEPVKHDVPAGATVEFETTWQPPGDAHYCVQARIDRYTRVPLASADEPDVDNNLAQTNYFSAESAPSSPATREVSLVDVHNPFDYALDAVMELRQDGRGYRSYVDHRWLRLEPGQTRSVRLEVESQATSTSVATARDYPDGTTWLRSWLEVDPVVSHTARTGAGVTMAVSTRVRTALRVLERSPERLQVLVSSPAGAPPPSEGTVVLSAEYEDGTSEVLVAEVEAGGSAVFATRPERGRGTLRYSGARGYGTGEPVDVELDRR